MKNICSLLSIGIFGLVFFGIPSAHASFKLVGITKNAELRLKRSFPDLLKGTATPSKGDEIIQKLMELDIYERVSLYQDGDVFSIVATPLRQISEVKIEGNKAIKEDEIREILNLSLGAKFSKKNLVDSAKELKKYYGEQGYFNSIVEIFFEQVSSTGIRVRYKITEGIPCLIEKIKLETKNNTLENRINRRLNGYVGDALSSEVIQEIRKKTEDYLISNRYLIATLKEIEIKYNVDKTRATLFYQVDDPFKYEVIIKGNSFFSLPEVYRLLDLGEWEQKDVEPAGLIAQIIQDQYIKKGFAHAQVIYSQKDQKKYFTKRIYINIKEGPRVKIQSIQVKGRISKPSEYYSNFIVKNSSDLIDNGWYNRQDLEVGYANLINHLNNIGYLKAKILSARVDYYKDRSEAEIVVNLDEGPLTQVRRISFEGTNAFSTSQLLNVIEIKRNQPLRLNKLEESIGRLRNTYLSSGYLEMKVLNEGKDLVSYNDSGTLADIRFKIYEGPKVKIGSIIVEGNSFTKSYVVLNEVDLELGETLTPEKIKEATERLNKLGIFGRSEIRTLEAGSMISNRTVVVTVTERTPGLLNFGMGVSNERELTLRGFTGVSYNNIKGTARGVSARLDGKYNVAQINYLIRKFTVGYLEPFLLETRTRGRVNVTSGQAVTEFSDDVATISQSNRIDFLLERDLTNHTRLTWTLWSLDAIRSFQHPKTLPDFDSNPQQIAAIGPTLDVDYRDNPFLPTKGSYFRWDVEYADPSLGSSRLIRFVKTESTYTYYQRLGSPRLVWANSARGGYLSNLNSKELSGVPAKHAFFLGGFSTVRGFGGTSGKERIPNENQLDYQSVTDLIIKSDSHYYLFKSELRYPIYGDFGGVLFYDGGAVLVSGVTIHQPYRQAAGFGFRFNTPVGPVSLDMGFKLRPREEEDKYRIHFSIGTF